LNAQALQEGAPRVAMVAPSLDILGGQGIQARDLAQALRSEGVQVDFVPVNPRFPRWLAWLRRVPVARTLLNQLLYICSLHRLRHVDVVHVFSAAYWSFLLAPLPAIVAGRLFGKRVILNYHSGEADDHLANWGWRVHPWLRMASTIAVPSVYLQHSFAKYGYNVHVVRNFIDLSVFTYRERNPLRPVLFSNRNLEVHYGVATTLAAYVLLKKRIPDASLTIAGYGSQLAVLQQKILDEGIEDVTLLGRVEPEKMPALYNNADVFLNASLIDNQPISILEAFASGLPVVTTPTGDIASMTLQGRAGTLIPENDPEAMATAIEQLLNAGSHAATLAQRAKAVVGTHAWSDVYQAWMELYQGHSREVATNS
jgi:glycosyltransferase involved in cell wall biosynthesis